MKHCLITGGAGFIGSHLAEHLLQQGCRVKIIDNLSTGSMRNIAHLKMNPAFSYVIDDCQNKNLMGELADEADEIYHLAAAVGVKMIVEDASKTIHLNYALTQIVLEMASKKKKPVLFTSSSEVYGKSDNIPYMEDGDLLLGSSKRWRWAYACSKLLDEFMVLAEFRKGLPAVILRLFNTVGPRQTGMYGMVIPSFVKQALNDEPITVYGDGSQSRCFCHVRDVVSVFQPLLSRKAFHGEVFNVGSRTEITILELAEKIRKQLASRSEIRLIPYEQAYNSGFEDMKRRIPCLDKISKAAGFTPGLSLERVISDVAEDVRRQENE